MLDVIFERVRKDRYIVDKSLTIFIMFFQRLVYKTLYIREKVRISYKDYIGTFYSLLVDKGETIPIIWMNE